MRQVRRGRTVAVIAGALLALGVMAPSAGASKFSNPAPFNIPDNAAATAYPSFVPVIGLSGSVVKATATLNGLTHGFPRDIDVLLVGPTGQKSLLMSDTCGGNATTDTTLTFDDGGTTIPNDTDPCPTGTYKPSEFNGATDVFPAPAPAGPYTASMANFNGQTPNGVWQLFVRDDAGGGIGSLARGWSIDVVTDAAKCAGQQVTVPANAGTAGDDVLTGTPGPDVFTGLGGKDTINGLGGADVICGGAGNDILRGGPGKDRLLGEGGKDKLKGNGGKDVCKGGAGRDTAGACEKTGSL